MLDYILKVAGAAVKTAVSSGLGLEATRVLLNLAASIVVEWFRDLLERTRKPRE